MGGERGVSAQNIITDCFVEMRVKWGLRRWGRRGFGGGLAQNIFTNRQWGKQQVL